jgi:AmmeMemoRadiSam system protein B
MRGAQQTVGIRPPAVAGVFYPRDPQTLRAVLSDCVTGAVEPKPGRRAVAEVPAGGHPRPKALISPHAGYVYSGPIAGSAYRALGASPQGIGRVVIIGPSHFVPLPGLAVPRAEAFETPLGTVPIDDAARHEVLRLPHVLAADEPHAREHSLEVQLPFLQLLLGEFSVLPLAAGQASAQEVAAALECLWGDEGTLIVVSSDLSHYLDYAAACRRDAATAQAILNYSTDLGGEQACGCIGINGLTHVARRRGLHVQLLDLRNSGDTAAGRSSVVGYGAFALYERCGGSGFDSDMAARP